MNFSPHQFARPFPPQYYPQNFNPFGVQPSYHRQFPTSSYHHSIPFHGNFHHRGDMAGNPSSQVGSTSMFEVGSRGEDSASLVNSPIPPAEITSKDQIRGEEWSDVDSDEGKKGGQMSNTYQNGQSDQQLMEKVHEEYKKVKGTEKPFPFECWWRVVKDEPKWLNRDVATVLRTGKRNKLTTSGAYTSSNQDTEEADQTEHRRPQGQKEAKEQRKGKGKVGKGRLSDDNVGQFNNLQTRKSEVIETMAAAAREHAQAIADMAAADKDKARIEKNQTVYSTDVD
ncbi:hypothetical protein HU200_029893 [Digitaria exilis]|uniref:No apical meristem-associated C-terminal domain-containing protein n=1 Tax=Digitaria exilis TaxID=1010633 RepID=A0A835ER88_9POAL|nr:hypothetical protein HU200_029893 [Digitaria exilis]